MNEKKKFKLCYSISHKVKTAHVELASDILAIMCLNGRLGTTLVIIVGKPEETTL